MWPVQGWLAPQGPCAVGCTDLDWLDPGCSVAPDCVSPERHLVGRLFYPTSRKTEKRGWRLFGGDRLAESYHYAKGVVVFVFLRRPDGWATQVAKFLAFVISYLHGFLHRLDCQRGAPLVGITPDAGDPSEQRCPVVVFSHGIGGWRNNYAIICSQLASQGYVVLSLEHADGTASAARLAGGRGWRYYTGMGGVEGQTGKTRHRMAEMRTGVRLLRAMDAGERVPGLVLSEGQDPASLLAGGLNFECLAAVGHSFGGAAVTALCAEDPCPFKCVVALDPWWYALPLDSAALEGWRTALPLLVVGSHDWYTERDARGELYCSSSRQDAVFGSAAATGGGAVHLVLSGSTHNTFADIVPYFANSIAPAFGAMGLTPRLDAVLGVHLVVASVLAFLSRRLPLPPAQRAAQNWAPLPQACALDRMLAAAARSREVTGLFSRPWLRPVKSAVNWVSDAALNFALRRLARDRSVAALVASIKETPEAKCERHDGYNDPYQPPAGAAAGRRQHRRGVSTGQGWAPEDLLTAQEVLESVMPSSDPGSPHRQAPSSYEFALGSANSAQRSWELGALETELLREGVGTAWRPGPIRGESDGEELAAAVGAQHVHALHVYPSEAPAAETRNGNSH